MFGILNEQNPLTRYKRTHIYEGWDKLAQKTGISVVTLIRIAKMNKEELKNLRYSMIEKINKELNINLIENYGKEKGIPSSSRLSDSEGDKKGD